MAESKQEAEKRKRRASTLRGKRKQKKINRQRRRDDAKRPAVSSAKQARMPEAPNLPDPVMAEIEAERRRLYLENTELNRKLKANRERLRALQQAAKARRHPKRRP